MVAKPVMRTMSPAAGFCRRQPLAEVMLATVQKSGTTRSRSEPPEEALAPLEAGWPVMVTEEAPCGTATSMTQASPGTGALASHATCRSSVVVLGPSWRRCTRCSYWRFTLAKRCCQASSAGRMPW